MPPCHTESLSLSPGSTSDSRFERQQWRLKEDGWSPAPQWEPWLSSKHPALIPPMGTSWTPVDWTSQQNGSSLPAYSPFCLWNKIKTKCKNIYPPFVMFMKLSHSKNSKCPVFLQHFSQFSQARGRGPLCAPMVTACHRQSGPRFLQLPEKLLSSDVYSLFCLKLRPISIPNFNF